MVEVDLQSVTSGILGAVKKRANSQRFEDDDAKEAWVISQSAQELWRVLPVDTDNRLIPISFDLKGEQHNVRLGLHAIYSAGLVLTRKEGVLEIPSRSLQILDLLRISYQRV